MQRRLYRVVPACFVGAGKVGDELKYIDIINAFWNSVTMNPLSTGQVSLYFALLHICNRSNWTEWFQAPNQVLSVLTGMSRSGILKARNELKQRGFIDFREKGTKATVYTLLIANSTQESKQISVQDSVQDSKQKGVQKSNTLKEKEKEKEKEKKKNSPPISPVTRFADFLSAYPKKTKNLQAVEVAYCKLLSDDAHLTESDLIIAAENYADACMILRTEERFIKSPQNFLRDGYLVDYLDGNYVKPKTQKNNQFNDFSSTSYEDISELEKKLLSK